MKLVRILPLTLAGIHAVIATSIFGVAIHSPEKSGLLPILLVYVDYPCSIILIEPLRRMLHYGDSVTQSLLADAVAYVVVGTLWFFLIGVLLRLVIERISSKVRTQE